MGRVKENYSCDELEQMLFAASKSNHANASIQNLTAEEKIGVSTAKVRKIASGAWPDLKTAQCLWRKGFYEARILAVLICPAKETKPDFVQNWLTQTESWAITDLIANELISENDTLFSHIPSWSRSDALFLKRGALSAIACRAKHANDLSESDFNNFSEILWAASDDDRQYIHKAASWALREIRKIDIQNKDRALKLANKLINDPSRSRNWVGKDAKKELDTLIKVSERPHLLSSQSPVGKRYLKKKQRGVS